jgi:hypothetical protein
VGEPVLPPPVQWRRSAALNWRFWKPDPLGSGCTQKLGISGRLIPAEARPTWAACARWTQHAARLALVAARRALAASALPLPPPSPTAIACSHAPVLSHAPRVRAAEEERRVALRVDVGVLCCVCRSPRQTPVSPVHQAWMLMQACSFTGVRRGTLPTYLAEGVQALCVAITRCGPLLHVEVLVAAQLHALRVLQTLVGHTRLGGFLGWFGVTSYFRALASQLSGTWRKAGALDIEGQCEVAVLSPARGCGGARAGCRTW